jgi:phage tail-like protein
MALSERSFVGGYYLLSIDNKDLGIVQSVDGVGIKGDLLTQAIGADNVVVKSIGGVTVEPLTFQVGAALSSTFYDWVEASWTHNYSRKDGSLVLCDFDMKPRHEIEFTQALVVETTVPALDANQKSPAMLTIKLQPESIKHITKPPRNQPRGANPSGQKQFQCQNFRFKLDHVDTGNVSKVEAFTIKQTVKPLTTGRSRWPQYEPMKLEYPNVTITTSLEGSTELFDWHKRFVIDGDAQVEDEQTGVMSLLTPDLKTSLLDVSFEGVGITSIAIEKSEASARTQVKRVHAELYVSTMKLDYKAGKA